MLSVGQHRFANHTCTLNESRLKTQPEFSAAWQRNIEIYKTSPIKGRMPGKLVLPGIYYEKVINKSITLI